MRTTTEQRVRVTLGEGDDALDFDVLFRDGRAAEVGVRGVRLDVEVVERLGLALDDVRQRGGDVRRCCYEHGYYLGEACGPCRR